MTGAELVQARAGKNLTQGDLAKALREAGHAASATAVCRWERGEVAPPEWLPAALERVPVKPGPARARGSYGRRRARRCCERSTSRRRPASAAETSAGPSKVRRSHEVSAGEVLDAAEHAICLEDIPEMTGAEIWLPPPRPPLVTVRRS